MNGSNAKTASYRSFKYAIGAIALLLLSTGSLLADQIVFSDPLDLSATGSISYAGGSNPLIGSDIQIRHVAGPDAVDHLVHDGGLTGAGVLNFQTGDFLGTISGDLIFGFLGAGNFIEIDGSVPDAGLTGSSAPVLLSGTNLLAIVDPQLGSIRLGLELGFGFDTKNPELLDFFGMAPGSQFVFSTVLVTPSFTPGSDGSFSAKVISSKVTNTVVPEPSSILLGLTAIFLVGGFRKLGWSRSAGN